jgi:hypothetical protein
VIAILIAYVLYIVLNSLLEVGSINMYKAAVVGIKPSSSHFFEGMKKYFLKVLGGNLFIHLITLILSPIIIALTIIYAVIFGTLTAGWALILLSVLVMVFLGVWNIIVVVDDIPPIKAIGIGITFGKKYFWPLFIVMLSNIMLTKYLAAAFGPLAAIIAGWFIVGIVTTYFKVVVLLIYNRRKADLI